MAYEISPPQGFFKVGEELKRTIYTPCHRPIIPLKRIFHRRIAAPEFSRGFQPTVGVNFFFPVASATIESRMDVAEDSAVADATGEYSPTIPWVETHG